MGRSRARASSWPCLRSSREFAAPAGFRLVASPRCPWPNHQSAFTVGEFGHLEYDVNQTQDKVYGRLETRRYIVVAAPVYLEELARCKDVARWSKLKYDAGRTPKRKPTLVMPLRRWPRTPGKFCARRGCIGALITDSIAAWISPSAKTPNSRRSRPTLPRCSQFCEYPVSLFARH